MVHYRGVKEKTYVTKIMVNEILFREDIPHRKINDVNEVLFFMCRPNQLEK